MTEEQKENGQKRILQVNQQAQEDRNGGNVDRQATQFRDGSGLATQQKSGTVQLLGAGEANDTDEGNVQPVTAHVSTVYHQQRRQGAPYDSMPLQSRGLTSNPSGTDLVPDGVHVPVMHNVSTRALDVNETHHVAQQQHETQQLQQIPEPIQTTTQQNQSSARNYGNVDKPDAPGRFVQQRTFQLEELDADDPDQLKRMVVVAKGSTQNLEGRPGMASPNNNTTSREISPSDRYVRQYQKENPSPKGTIKKGAVFKKQTVTNMSVGGERIAGTDSRQLLMIDNQTPVQPSPPVTQHRDAMQRDRQQRATLVDQRSDALDSNSIETSSHPRFLKGHATQGRVGIHGRNQPKFHGSSDKSLGVSPKGSAEDHSLENTVNNIDFQQQVSGKAVVVNTRVPIITNQNQNQHKQESDLDLIRQENYQEYLMQATAMLEQEQRKLAAQDGGQGVQSDVFDQRGRPLDQSLAQHPSIHVSINAGESPRNVRLRDSLSLTARHADQNSSARKPNFSNIVSARTARGNSSVISGVQRKHDQQIEEVRQNHFQKVSVALNRFMQDKRTSDTVEDSVEQARKRMLPNSYQIVKKQLDNVSDRNVRKNKGVTAVKNFEFGIRMPSRETMKNADKDQPMMDQNNMGNNYKRDLSNFIAAHQKQRQSGSQPGGRNAQIVLPKTQVQVPKELIMMKIANRENQLDEHHAQSFMESQVASGLSENQYMSSSVQNKPGLAQKQNFLMQDSVMSHAGPDGDSIIDESPNKLPFLPGNSSIVQPSNITQRKDSYMDFLDSIQQSMYLQQHGKDMLPSGEQSATVSGLLATERSKQNDLASQQNSGLSSQVQGSKPFGQNKRNSVNFKAQQMLSERKQAKQFASVQYPEESILTVPGNIEHAASTQVGKGSSMLQPTQNQTGNNVTLFESMPANRNETSEVDEHGSMTMPGVNYHITDLLERSIQVHPKEQQIKPNLDFFKRSVKAEGEIVKKKEVIIKNYRLRVVDANTEISEMDRKLMVKAKGSNIFVSNSLIKPEIYRYSTKVSDAITEVFHVMRDHDMKQHKDVERMIGSSHAGGINSPDFESLNFQDQVEFESKLAEKESHEMLKLSGAKDQDGLSDAMVKVGQQDVHELQQYQRVGALPGEIQLPGTSPREGSTSQVTGPYQSKSNARISGLENLSHDQQVNSRVGSQDAQLRHQVGSRMIEGHAGGRSSLQLSVGTGKSRGAYYDQEELEAMKTSVELYTKWVRGIKQPEDFSEMPLPERKILGNGEPIAPSIKDINFSIMLREGKQDMLKQKEVPYEKMTAMTQFVGRPYLHLMRSVVSPEIRSCHQAFMNATVKYREKNAALTSKTHASPTVQILTEDEFMEGLKFCNEELTHLDAHLISDHNLTSNYFIPEEPSLKLAKRLEEEGKIRGKTMYYFKDNEFEEIDIDIVSYDPILHKFQVQNTELNINMMRERPLFSLVDECEAQILTKEESERERKDAIVMRAEAKQYLRVSKLIQNELLQRYSYIGMEDPVRMKIHHRIACDMGQFPKRSVRMIILQVEALYIFSILKSMLSSQRNDPFIRNMFFNFRIANDSPALEVFKQRVISKQDLPGISQFKMAGARDELEFNSLIFSNKKYIAMPRTLESVTGDALGKLQLFQFPLSMTLLIQAGAKQYAKINASDLETMVNKFPLQHDHFVVAQRVVAQFFNTAIRGKWSENIAIDIGKTILEDFQFQEQEEMTEDMIAPELLRLFYQIKQYQQTQIVQMFEQGMRDLLRFIIGFANRNLDVRNSTIMNTLKHTTSIRLTRTDPREVDFDGTGDEKFANDLDRIPLQHDPMVKLQITCQQYGKARKKRTKFVAEPDLESIQKDLFSIVRSMHDALKGVRRVDAIILPNLKRKAGYLLPPDTAKNDKLKSILKMTDKLLEQCCRGCKTKLSEFNKYTSMFDKKTETIVLELKKQSFLQANEGMSGSENDQEDGDDKPPGGPESEPEQAESVRGGDDDDDEDDIYGSEDGSDAEGGGTGAQNYQAYKSVEVDQGLLRDEINNVRKSIWTIRENIQEDYDFGLLFVDCRPFKYELLEHCLKIESHLEEYVKSDFSEKIKNIQSEIATVTGRLNEKVSSIDDVIQLLTYIDTLKRQDNKVEEIREMIDPALKEHMDYIESLKIMFEDDMYHTYLTIRNWPRTFNSFIQKKKQELLEIKESLIKEMSKETERVFKKVKMFQKQILQIMRKGLSKLGPIEMRSRKEFLDESIHNIKFPSSSNVAPEPLSKDGSVLTCFEWLSSETNWNKKRFDSTEIEKVWDKTQQMNTEFDEIDKLTLVINKREQLLGITKTQFNELKEIQDDLKPLFDLWQVASRFNRTLPIWIDGQFESLDSQDIEQTLEEWLIELKRLQKTNLIKEHKKQSELLTFMFEVLNYFRRYLPMIKMLRTRGMTPNHWMDISRQLEIKLDRQNVTLFKCICKGLHEEDKLRVIKAISDQATREYAVRCSLDMLDKDVKNLEFYFENAPDGMTPITKKTHQIIRKFEEYSVRCNVLKNNPYVKICLNDLLDLERTVKTTSELVAEWILFQRNWLYLNGIFCRQEMVKQPELSTAMKYFQQIDTLFRSMIKSISNTPQVYRMANTEKNYLVNLRKANSDADIAREGLSKFLLDKRDAFPRLYFLSNEELIDIYGRSDDLIDMIIDGKALTFLQNLFEGIDQLAIDESTRKIEGLWSKQGEYIEFNKLVETHGIFPDKWLRNLEKEVGNELKHQLWITYENMDADLPVYPEEKDENSKKTWQKKKSNHTRTVNELTLEKWISTYPAQCTYLATQIWFTQKTYTIFESAKGRKRHLNDLRDVRTRGMEGEVTSESDEYASLADCNNEQLEVLTYKAKQDAELKRAQEKEEAAQDAEEDDGGAGTRGGSEQDAMSPELRPGSSPEREPDGGREGSGPGGQETKLERDIRVARQSKLTSIEKLMRTWDRFREDPSVHPGKLYAKINDEVDQKILIIATFMKKKIKGHVRISGVGLLTILVYYRDLASQLADLKVFKASDFNWEMHTKYYLDKMQETVQTVDRVTLAHPRNTWEHKIKFERLECRVDIFNHPRQYGFEYLGSCSRLVITPLTERCHRSLLVAMQYNYGGAPEGPFGTGKTETTKDLARQLGKVCFVLNTSAAYEYDNVLKFFKGVAASGSWVVFDEFNRMDTGVLAFLSQVIIQIQTALRMKMTSVNLDEAKVNLIGDCSIIITTNPGYAGRTELPVNLKNLFRTVSMAVPDSTYIAEILLYSSGFTLAERLAQKMVQVQNMANILMQRLPHVSYDFGLRAIKSIIKIAQNLKMQAHNIWESELPDIINDSALENVPWRGNQMIVDVQNEMNKVDESQEFTDARETEQSGDKMKYVKTGLGKSRSNIKRNRSKGDEMTKTMSPHKSSSRKILAGSPDPARHSPLAAIAERDGPTATPHALDSMREGNSVMSGSHFTNSFHENPNLEAVHELPEMHANMNGEFFEAVFSGGKTRTERQTKSIYQQIGISVDMQIDDDLLEEYIIIKAIRDYNHSKFSNVELFLIEGVIKDVFTGSVSELDLLQSDYGNLKELILQSFIQEKLDYSKTMNQKTFQLYEISQVNVGCLLVGTNQSGKSSMIKLLESALNRASNNELKIRCAQERKNRLRDFALNPPMEGGNEIKRDTQQRTSKGSFDPNATKVSLTSGGSLNDTLGKKGMRNAKGGKQNEKNKNAMWQEWYKRTKLEPWEIEEQKTQLANQGVKTSRMNPKSIHLDAFFGEINQESNVWTEGIFTTEFRRFSADQSRSKKWILLDGPIDFEWVENLNSILDDNRRMNLPNGQTIKMSEGMCLLMETDSTRNITPATISRCGMIFLNREEMNRPKHILNQFMQRLPPNLADYVKDLENQINWLMPTCLEIFNREKTRRNLILNDVDEFWIVQNLVRLLDAFTFGYWIDFINSNKDDSDDPLQQAALQKTQNAHRMQSSEVDRQVNDDDKLDPIEILQVFKSKRLKSAANEVGSEFGPKKVDFRIAINDFASNDMRIENSLKFIPMWLEAFTIMSVAWTFQPILKEPARKELAQKIEAKITEGRGDFASYQKNKKKQTLAKNMKETTGGGSTIGRRRMAKDQSGTKTLSTGKSRTGRSVASSGSSNHGKSSRKRTTLQAFKKGFSPDGIFLVENEAGMTIEFTDKIDCPMFIAEFPFEKGLTIFDVYFNMDNSTWAEVNFDGAINKMQMAQANLPTNQRAIQNVYVPTPDIVRMMHTVEVLVMSQNPILLTGDAACGKSSFMKDFINQQLFVYAKDISSEHVTCSHHLDSTNFKEYIERYLEVKKKAPRLTSDGTNTKTLLGNNSTKKNLMITGSNQDIKELNDSQQKSQGALVGGQVASGLLGRTSQTSGTNSTSDVIGEDGKMKKTVAELSKTLRPPGKENKLIVYLEDVHLAFADRHSDQPGIEALRDYLTCQTWFSTHKKGMRQIEDVNFVACMDTRAPERELLTNRLLYKFFLLGMEPISTENSSSLYRQILEIQANAWPSVIQKHMFKVANSISQLYDACLTRLKPTPMKVQYVQSKRECFKIIYAMARIEGNVLKTELNLMKLFYHECLRLYGDRILMKHDLTWFMECLKNVCQDNFNCCTKADELEEEKANQQAKNPIVQRRTDSPSNDNVTPQVSQTATPNATAQGRSNFDVAKSMEGGADHLKIPPITKDDDVLSRKSESKIEIKQEKENLASTGMSRPSRIKYDHFPIKQPSKLWFSVLNEEVEGCYQQVNDTENVTEMVENWIAKYNEQTDRPHLNLILYSELNKHLLKILRAISQPDGHLIVVGLRGYGITQLIKLATFIASVQFNEMEMSTNFTSDDWLGELRRILTYTIEEDKQACYVVDEYRVQSDLWYRDLETLVKTQTSSEVLRYQDNLASLTSIMLKQEQKVKEKELGVSKSGSTQGFSQSAIQNTGSDARITKMGKGKLMKSLQSLSATTIQAQVIKSLQMNHHRRAQVYKVLLKQVRKNFHIVLNFSPSGDNFRVKIEKYKQLMMCSQLIWIQNLQCNDLVQIGHKVFIEKELDLMAEKNPGEDPDIKFKHLKEAELNEKILRAVAIMYLQTQKMSKKFQDDFTHTLYFTPCFFIRVFETYKQLLDERTKNVQEISEEYAAGLDKIRSMMDQTRDYLKELSERTPLMVEKQHKLVSVLVDIEEEHEKVSHQREMLKKQEILLEVETKEAGAVFAENQQAFDKIMPCLNEALESMKTLNKSDIEEIRTLDHPPKVIKLVMKAICMIIEEPPTTKRNRDGTYEPSYWKTAIGQKVLGNPKFIQNMVEFDRKNITLEKMAEIEDVLAEPNYTYENACKASKGIVGLYKWVKAIRDYYYIFQEMEPRRDALALSEKQYEEKKEALSKLQENILSLDEQIEGLIQHQENKKKTIDQLKLEIDDCNSRKKRADALVKGLSAEKQKQIVCQRMLDHKYATVQGDVVLSAAYVTLASGFTQKYRSLLLTKWQRALNSEYISCNHEFILQELFGDTFTIRDWHANGLPKDNISIDNAIIMQKTRQYVVCVDPQMQAVAWIKSQWKLEGKQPGDHIRSTTIRDVNFKKHLEIAIELGVPMLISELPEQMDVHIESVIQKDIITYTDQKMIKFCRRQLTYNDNFQLFMATSIGKPHFDVNISNHVCLVNFFVTVEGLTHNLLSKVVANERKDLEETYNKNVKEMYERIQSLKQIKNQIIDNMKIEAHEILSDEKLIDTLRESKETAEIIARHLKKISSTNLFLQKAREQYAPVAYRASNLYFAVSDLWKVNPMYQYSLDWFTNIFVKSLTLANQVQDGADVTINDEEYRLLNNKYSPEQRISILIKTFTQELMKKVIFSAFQEDRQLVTYFVSLRVLEAEQLTDSKLMEFALTGSRRVSPDVKSPGPSIGLPWLNDLMWAELKYLSKLKPFNFANLTSHIEQNPTLWHCLIDKDQVNFEDLPNNGLLNLKQFSLIDVKLIAKQAEEVKEEASDDEDEFRIKKVSKKDSGRPKLTGKKSSNAISREDSDENPILIKDDASSGDDMHGDQRTAMGEGEESLAGSKQSKRKFTEAEILADESLWQVSDESDYDEEDEPDIEVEENSQSGDEEALDRVGSAGSKERSERPKKEKKLTRKDMHARVYNRKQRNPNWYDDNNTLRDEETEMARFLIEKAPAIADTQDFFTEMQRRTKYEKEAHQTKEFILRCQVELAILRCIRPDLVQACLHNIVSAIYDFNYANFGVDILARFIDVEGTLAMKSSKTLTSSTNFRPKVKSKMGDSEKGTKGFKMPSKKNADSDYQLLIKEAYEESTQYTPILFLVTHSVDIHEQLKTFQVSLNSTNPVKLNPFTVSKGIEKKVEEQITKCAQVGDWLLVQNIHLMPEWMPELESLIQSVQKPNTHKKFRVFFTCIQMDDCSSHLLRKSIKVALQQPTGIKKRIERQINDIEKDKDGGFKRSNTNGNFHKNMFFGLAYFYSILDGRKEYGTLGWNVFSGFDSSDFEISMLQLYEVIKKEISDPEATVNMLKYQIGQLNFGGKIHRKEDMRKLMAHLEDLINLEYALFIKEADADEDRSHFGFPPENCEMHHFLARMPVTNPARIFGFNRTIERAVNQKKSAGLCQRIYHLNKSKIYSQSLGFANLEADLEGTSIKISLAKSTAHAKSYLMNTGKYQGPVPMKMILGPPGGRKSPDAMIKVTDSAASIDPSQLVQPVAPPAENMIHLFVILQKLLRQSSLDLSITEDTDRYDEKIDTNLLAERDINDRKASEIAKQMIQLMNNIFSSEQIHKKFPIKSERILNSCFNKEIHWYVNLLDEIRKTVDNLVLHIDGKTPRPLDVEKLWYRIQNNQVPSQWKPHAFQTAFTTLADFLLELTEKLNFWQRMLEDNGQVPALWLPAFYDVSQLMYVLIQRRSRTENIATRLLVNNFVVMGFTQPTEENCPVQEFSTYLYGLNLQGAEWDFGSQMLIEVQTPHLFQEFPIIKVVTEQIVNPKNDGYLDNLTRLKQNIDEFNDNPQPSRKEQKAIDRIKKLKKERMQKGLDSMENLLKDQPDEVKERHEDDEDQAPDEESEEEEDSAIAELEEIQYMYRCPVFKTTLRLQKDVEYQEKVPLFYIDLPTKVHPRKWVKRSVALLLETTR